MCWRVIFTNNSVAQWLALYPHRKSWVWFLVRAGPFCMEVAFSTPAPVFPNIKHTYTSMYIISRHWLKGEAPSGWINCKQQSSHSKQNDTINLSSCYTFRMRTSWHDTFSANIQRSAAPSLYYVVSCFNQAAAGREHQQGREIRCNHGVDGEIN